LTDSHDDDLPVVYSNFDHKLNRDVANRLFTGELIVGVHAAHNYVGYLSFAGGTWREEVYQYGRLRSTFEGTSALNVVEAAIHNYGSE
jgi:hypothetical protein